MMTGDFKWYPGHVCYAPSEEVGVVLQALGKVHLYFIVQAHLIFDSLLGIFPKLDRKEFSISLGPFDSFLEFLCQFVILCPLSTIWVVLSI